RLNESPTFAKLKEEGGASTAPYAEAFGQWKNLKLVILALCAVMSAQGAVWYTTFFYSQTFLDKFLKVAPETINMVLMIVTAVSAVFYVVFGALSDRVGRKPVMLFGMTLMLVAYFPGFHMLAQFANPALAEAQARTPVVISADPADCSLQFDPVGKKVFVSSCDVARSILANAGVSYDNQRAAPGTPAVVRSATSPSPPAPRRACRLQRSRLSGRVSRPRSRRRWRRRAIRQRPIRRVSTWPVSSG
ncbi:MAG: MFS transporter, partial [Phenylobacterium sp.]